MLRGLARFGSGKTGCVSIPRHVTQCPQNHSRRGQQPRIRSSSGEERQVGCPDLYNLCEAINADKARSSSAVPPFATPGSAQATPAAPPSPASGVAGSSAGAEQQQQQRGASYYAGMLTSDIAEDNGASGTEMLKRSMQLAGGMAVLLAGLVLAFLASNGAI